MRNAADSTKIAAAIIVASLIIGLALFLRPMPDRYRFDVNGGEIRRYDSAAGRMVVCNPERCVKIDMTKPIGS